MGLLAGEPSKAGASTEELAALLEVLGLGDGTVEVGGFETNGGLARLGEGASKHPVALGTLGGGARTSGGDGTEDGGFELRSGAARQAAEPTTVGDDELEHLTQELVGARPACAVDFARRRSAHGRMCRIDGAGAHDQEGDRELLSRNGMLTAA
jgi:hypothetical protein